MYDTFSQMLPFSVAMFDKKCKKRAGKQGGSIYKIFIISISNLSKIGQFVIAAIDRCHFFVTLLHRFLTFPLGF